MKWIKKNNIKRVKWEESIENDYKLRVLQDLEKRIFCYIFKENNLIHKEIIESSIADGKNILEKKLAKMK